MTRAEAVEVLKLWNRWNEGQTSVSLAFRGERTMEDDLLDERRRTIICAMKLLQSNEAEA
jgi:hypothetical protein